MKKYAFISTILLVIIITCGLATAVEVPGTNADGLPIPEQLSSVEPLITENGFISLSVDGLGTISDSGIIQVEKPAGATVRSAYLAAASTGFSDRILADGDVSIDGVPVSWNVIATTPSSISSHNSFADVTALVQSKIDAAPAGLVDFTITELATDGIDGEILAVIFDDPNQVTSNTIVLLFGAQDVLGDTFAIGLAEPINLSDPNLRLDFSLGISFSHQPTIQDTLVDVNGARLTTSAGGEDDGTDINGALLTVGGIGDSNLNPPDPFARGDQPSCPRCDDELYDLIPFVNNGDTNINVFTQNPSIDDNVFFAALFLGSTTAVVNEGITLSPLDAVNPVGTDHTVTAKVQDDAGNPIQGREVRIKILTGPHAGRQVDKFTDANGEVTVSYTGTSPGIDTIVARMRDSNNVVVSSNTVTKEWTQGYCGDGNLDPGEQCDDGNNEPGDGCDAECRLESEICNNLVTFVPIRSTYRLSPDTTGCGGGFAGTFTFDAELGNPGSSTLSDNIVIVVTLSNGNLLKNADGGPGGVGAELTVPLVDDYADGLLSTGESVDVPFELCLTSWTGFNFWVDVECVVHE